MRKTTFFVGVLLFATGFAGVVGWSWREHALDAGAGPPRVEQRLAAAMRSPNPAHEEPVAPLEATPPVERSARAQLSAPLQRPAPVMDAAAQMRHNEVAQLAAAPPDEGVPVLQGLLKDSPDEETRLLAVRALSELARKGDSEDVSTGDEIRSSVLQAAYDEDPGVAKAAQDEYARLNGFDR